MKRLLLVVVVVAALVAAATPPPASAVVHEIVAAWCNGGDPLDPLGLSRDGSKNFAQPVFAGGVVQIVPYAPGGPGAILIDFDFTKPQIKIVPTGQIIQLAPTVFIEGFVIDPTFPAFKNCKNLQP